MFKFDKLVEILNLEVEIFVPYKVNGHWKAISGRVIRVQSEGSCVVWLLGSTTAKSFKSSQVFLDKASCKLFIHSQVKKPLMVRYRANHQKL